ncbi:alpha/beta hydrolase [Streptomyces sp. AM 4-1-1]|uniref:alpha/beta hydrolase n=1 Tax=Streptomyces sp. AM 4-1-1 TaxID=3028710 RepID=UPI0023B89421|nr:alpha/beta hydrolase [Streptomyces sp. AM 4-1-1]WEH33931.1 alpha/beta hydrolase [Streptomyces sp. AM 4-1-1]
MDYVTLKALEPSEFEDAADGYRATALMAQAAKEHIDNTVATGMRKSLQGVAADAAQKQLQALSRNFHYTQTECGVISTALNGFAYDMAAVKRTLESAVADAHAERFTVNSDGSVTYPAAPDRGVGTVPRGGTANGVDVPSAQGINRQAAQFDPNPHYARAQAIADRIADALKRATAADEKWSPKLRALTADDDLTVSDRDWADVTSDTSGVRTAAVSYLGTIEGPPKEGSAEANAQWWKGLSVEDRAACVSMHPASIGALNGLPADVRDEANRVVLAEQRGATQERLDTWLKKEPTRYEPYINPVTGLEVKGAAIPTKEWKEWNKEKDRLEGRLHGMDLIQNRFDMTGKDGLPEAYLLGFDSQGKGGDGRVILANGNPDTADHTAIYIPGTGTQLKDIGGDLDRGKILWQESHGIAQDSKISTITWFDYDAPRSASPGEKGDIFPEAMFDDQAAEGGPVLRDFLDGSRAAHVEATGGTGHTTAVGHSYGTTVIGDAAKSGHWPRGPLAVDDVLVAGSPGMQADRAGDLGIKPGHMWAMGGGGNDNFVREGGRWLAGLGDNWTIPTDPAFGSNVLESDSVDHSGFWDENSLALRQQAYVITGQYEWTKIE